MEVWQTTNQEPWVSALVDGAIKLKTRTSAIHVPVGSPILLHCSSKVWPSWHDFINQVMIKYAMRLDELKANFGRIIAVGIVSKVGIVSDYSERDLEPWNVTWGNCAAPFTWEVQDVIRLSKPVKARGFQAPFCRAKPEVVAAVLKANPAVAPLLGQ